MIDSWITPLKLLLFNIHVVNELHWHRDIGIEPDNWLLDTFISCSADILPILAGIGPVRLLLFNNKRFKCIQWHNVSGIVPTSKVK